MESEHPIIEAEIFSHTRSVHTVSFSPDQKKLCSAGNGKKAILKSLENKEMSDIELIGHKDTIYDSSFSTYGNYLATCSLDKTVRIWSNMLKKSSISTVMNMTVLEGHTSFVESVKFFHHDKTKVISGGRDKMIKIWSIERKKEISTITSDEWIHCVDILPPDNQTIVTGDGAGNTKIWDIRSGKSVHTFQGRDSSWICSVQFHPRTFSLAFGKYRTIRIFDFRTFQLLQKYKKHSRYVRSVCFHPSGKYIVSGSRDTTIKLFDLDEKKVLYTLEDHYRTVHSVQFSPDGEKFASGSLDCRVLLWTFPPGYRRNINVKDIDEDERIEYLLIDIIFLCENEANEAIERNERTTVLRIKIRNIDDVDENLISCYKSFFVL